MVKENVFGEGKFTRAHEFHRSKIEGDEECLSTYGVEKARKSAILKNWNCGLYKNKTLAGYPHIHFYSNKDIPKNFIKECIKYKNEVE